MVVPARSATLSEHGTQGGTQRNITSLLGDGTPHGTGLGTAGEVLRKRKPMTLTNLRTHRPAKYPGLTELNLATSKAYAACDGCHTPSGETVRRWFPGADRDLPVCSRCGCPYAAPKANWSSGTSRARGPRLP